MQRTGCCESKIWLVLALAVASVACSRSPSGTVDGISYRTSLKGGYSLVVSEEGDEHVWFAPTQNDPSLSLRVQVPPTPAGETPRCTEDREDYTWSNPGGFVMGRDGALRWDGPAQLGMSLCSKTRPEVTLRCSVFREGSRAELSTSDIEAFAEVCRGVTVE